MIVVKSKKAQRDLVSIHNFIAEENSSRVNADRYMRLIEGKLQLIATQPLIGRVRDDLQPGVRCHPFDRYLILYRPGCDRIEIVRILHAARDVESMFH